MEKKAGTKEKVAWWMSFAFFSSILVGLLVGSFLVCEVGLCGERGPLTIPAVIQYNTIQ